MRAILITIVIFYGLLCIASEEGIVYDSLNCTKTGWIDFGFAEDVVVSGNYAYIADGSGGMKIVDISNHLEPSLVSSYQIVTPSDSSDYALRIAVLDNHAFIAYNMQGLVVMDVSDPRNPSKVFQLNPDTEQVKDVYVVRENINQFEFYDYVFVASKGHFLIYKIKGDLFGTYWLEGGKEIAKIEGIFATGVHVVGNHAYLADEESGYLRIVELPNKLDSLGQTPIKIVGNVMTGKPFDVFVEENYAYVIDVKNGFTIVDISNSSNPRIVKQYRDSYYVPEEGSSFIVNSDKMKIAYVGLKSFGLIVFDVTDISNIKHIGHYGSLYTGYGSNGVCPVDNIIYTASYKNGLEVIEHLKNGYRFTMTYTPEKLKYEDKTEISVVLKKDYGDRGPFYNMDGNGNDAQVYIEDKNGIRISDIKKPDETGKVIFEILKEDTFPIYIVSKNEITTDQIEKQEVKVDYRLFKVSYPKECPVLKNNLFSIKVQTEYELPVIEPEPKQIIIENVPDASVIITDNIGAYNVSGLTDTNGNINFSAYLKSNRALQIIIDKKGFVKYSSTITPYLWSNVRGAFGRNNQEHIVRKPNTDEMEMLYTTGDSVVYGRSEDFGQTWELEILGKGKEPALTRTKDGLIAIWKEGESTFWYSIKHSPWTPVDTLISPTVWFTEPVVGYNYTTDKTYMGYIGNRYLNIERGDYILGSMEGIDIGTLVFDTVVSYYGEDNKVPMKSPVFSLFYDISSTSISHLIGFIDTTKNYLYKLYTSKLPQWTKLRTINKSGQVCNAPTADYYGEVTTFAYEVINIDGTRDIWKAKMIDGFLTEPERINTFIGVNKYPKVKNNYLHLYVNNDKKLISEPGYGLTIEQNIIRETTDSIFSYDVNFKDTYTNRKGFFIWTEGENGFYRLNMKEVSYKTEPVPYVISLPQDTIERVTTSPLYDNNYLGRKEPVERLNTTIVGLDPEMSYNVRVITSEGSPVKPQIIQIDGEVYGVVYGHANREDTTEIVLPKGIYEDNKIVISIDRKKGNPNRVSKVEVYQYETEGEKEIVTANKVKVLQAINMTETTEVKGKKEGLKVSYISDREGEVEIEVYDIRGSRLGIMKSQVKAGLNEIGIGLVQKSGIYFVRIRDGEKGETRKINIIK